MDRSVKLKFFQSRIPLYRKNITLFATEVLKFTPDKWQDDVFKDIAVHNRVSVKSGQGVGKTGCEAIVVLWFLSCHPFARVVATAPTRQQLNDVLWSEIAKWQSKSPLLTEILKWTKTYIYMVGYEKRWFAVARAASRPENMQGFHEDNMLFIVDEASGVADPIMEAILGTLSGKNNKLFMCGNPTKTSGTFFDSHTKDRSIYKCHTVNSEKVDRVSKDNIASLKRKYGEDSNVVRVRVYGEFPMQEDDVFIPLSLIEQSVMSEPKMAVRAINGQEVRELVAETIDIGCDVARFGDDKTIIGFKVNEKVEFYKKIRGQDTMRTAADIVMLGKKLIDKYTFKRRITIKIDDGGVGGGVVDRLRQIKKSDTKEYWWMNIIPVKFGAPIKHRFFHDTTTFMMSVVKSLLSPFDDDGKPKPVELVLPNDEDLIGQLSCRKYDLTSANKIKVESKKEMKERDLPSPDEADCILLCCLPIIDKSNGKKVKEHE